MDEWSRQVTAALSESRVARLHAVSDRTRQLRDLVDLAETAEVLMFPLRGGEATDLRVKLGDDDWVVAEGTGGALAIDMPTDEAGHLPYEALFYPELQSRLTSWWLAHAWRYVDLVDDCTDSLLRWRINSCAVLARAIIEEVGCLLFETRKLLAAWADAKALSNENSKRPERVRSLMSPTMVQAAFGSRMSISHPDAQATNVLTYVKKLAKETGESNLSTWYDWLSDTSHPALGSRIAMSSQPIVHSSGATSIRVYSRRPAPILLGGMPAGQDFPIAHAAADSIILCGNVANTLLECSLQMVDDFGLTTSTGTLTRRQYWRKFTPTRGKRPCPCGRGSWSTCQHWWGGTAPSFELEKVSQAD